MPTMVDVRVTLSPIRSGSWNVIWLPAHIRRGSDTGINHLGLQVDSDDELADMRERLLHADAGLVEEIGANCCYAKSDKYWVTDPQGIAWETYHSLGAIPMFGADGEAAEQAAATPAAGCCAPAAAAVDTAIPVKVAKRCCA